MHCIASFVDSRTKCTEAPVVSKVGSSGALNGEEACARLASMTMLNLAIVDHILMKRDYRSISLKCGLDVAHSRKPICEPQIHTLHIIDASFTVPSREFPAAWQSGMA